MTLRKIVAEVMLIVLAYGVGWRGHVDVEPDSRIIESQVGVDELPGARRLRVPAVLKNSAQEISIFRGQSENHVTSHGFLQCTSIFVLQGTLDSRIKRADFRRRHFPGRFTGNRVTTTKGTHRDRVLHVCDRGGELWKVQLWAVDDGEGEVAGRPPGLGAVRLPLLVVGEVGRVILPRRDALRAGQSAHVHDDAGLQVLVGEGDPVGEDEPTLGVSVVDLDRAARVEGVDVVGAGGALAHGVLGQAEDGVKVGAEALPDGRVEGAQDAGGAAAVALHAGHGSLTLEQKIIVNFYFGKGHVI